MSCVTYCVCVCMCVLTMYNSQLTSHVRLGHTPKCATWQMLEKRVPVNVLIGISKILKSNIKIWNTIMVPASAYYFYDVILYFNRRLLWNISFIAIQMESTWLNQPCGDNKKCVRWVGQIIWKALYCLSLL